MALRETRQTSKKAAPGAAIGLLVVACAVFGTISAASAQTSAHHRTVHHRVVNPPPQLQLYAPEALNAARDQAIHECSVAASRFSNRDFESTQLATYGTCMSEHGQIP